MHILADLFCATHRTEHHYSARIIKLLRMLACQFIEFPRSSFAGLYSYGRGFIGYWALPTYSQSINLSITCLQHFFDSVLSRESRLPPYCFLQMDNAAKDNKNVVMFAYLCMLVQHNWFECVYVHFLPPGHTHSNLDQKYSVISQRLKKKDVFCLPQLINEVHPLFNNEGEYTSHHIVPAVGDHAAFFKDKVNNLSGHGTCLVDGVNRRLHAFKVCKDNMGRAGPYIYD
jgi:hypothetical protein